MGLGVDRILDLFDDYAACPAADVGHVFGPQRRILCQSDGGSEEALLGPPQTDRFEVRQVTVNGSLKLLADDRFSILIVLEGKGDVVADAANLPACAWDSVLLPAALREVQLHGELKAARCLPPAAGREDAFRPDAST